METVLLLIVALIVLSLLVVVHEFGHFIAAKIVGVWPEEFGIGLPPRVWGKKIGETIWSLNALPLGGFVRLHGEMGEKNASDARAFMNASKLKRGIIAVAGVTMNLVYAVLAFSLVFFVQGIPERMTGNAPDGVKVSEVASNSPASKLGLTPNDVVLFVNDRPINDMQSLPTEVLKVAGHDITIKYRDFETQTVLSATTLLREKAPENEGLLGITYEPAPVRYLQVSGITKFFYSLYYGAIETYNFSTLILREFSKMFTQIFVGQVPQGLTGPLGVVGVTAEVAKQGIIDLVRFSALISINLALINLVPFPPLDGSRVLFLFIERIVGKKRLPKYEEKVHTIGMYILLGLMLLLTIREVPKLLTAGSLTGFVQKLIN